MFGERKWQRTKTQSAYRKEQDLIIHEILYFWPMTKKKEELKELDEEKREKDEGEQEERRAIRKKSREER